MKKKLLLVLSFILFFSLAACKNDETELKDDLVVMGMLAAESLDPMNVGASDKVVNFQIFDSLVRYGADGNIAPGLAESFDLGTDGLTYTFTIRDDVIFHDDTDLTVDDIIFSIDKMMEQPMNSWMMTYVASWTKIDESTIEVVKASPFAKVLNIFADRLFIVPEDLYTNDYDSFEDMPIGTGAYKFVSQAADKSVTLIKNENYFFGEPAITNLKILAPVESSAAVIQLETGEVDIIFGIPTAQKAILTSNDDVVFAESAGWQMHTLLLMGEELNDINLRKAISYAVNPENAILVANEGIGEVPTNLFSTKTMGALAGEVAITGYNSTLSAQFLAESNYTSELDLVITVDASAAAIAQSIQSDLAAVGITVTIEQLDTNALYAKLMNGELDMTILPMGTHMNGIEEMLAFPTMPPFSFGMSPSEARAAIIASIQTETNTATRENLCEQAIQYAIDEFDIVPVFEPVSNLAYSAEIAGIDPISAATNIFYLGEVVLSEEE